MNLQKYNGEMPTIRWTWCIEDRELIKDIPTYAKENGISESNIRGCSIGRMLQCKRKHYVYYDIYINMTEEEKIKKNNRWGKCRK